MISTTSGYSSYKQDTAKYTRTNVAIHNQSEPPLPGDRGSGVPTGRSTFISIKNKTYIRNSAGEYQVYSELACLVDCLQLKNVYECLSARSFYCPDTTH